MSGNSLDKNLDQPSISDILKLFGSAGNEFSSAELEEAINKLQQMRSHAEHREKIEKEKREREQAERKAREEKQRREVYVNQVTCMDLPLDWDNAFNSDARAQGVHTDSIPDALIISLTTLGRVDIEFISAITGAEYKTVIGTLKGSIYQNPQTWNECFYKGWETADEYLSGNLMRKWKAAEQANKEYGGYFSDNLRAIERVLPPAVPAKDIYITLGSPWVPADIIDDFIIHLFGDPCEHLYGSYDADQIRETWKTIHDEITGTWEIPYKSRYGHSVGVRKSYGTHRLEALHILEKTLNMKTVTVTDKISSSSNALGKKRVVNKAETVAAIEKQQKQIEEFQKWVWEDEARKERLEKIFESKFGCVRRRIFDGSFLDFPGMSSSVQLYPYQKDAVARIIFSPNTLLAHNVGAGKTYVMIAAGQEMRRMGLSKKNLYVVPNNIVDQWKSIFLLMYPNAELLCVTPRSFTPRKREAVLKQIRDKDYDGIIMAYSCFEQIPLSKDYCIEELRKNKDHIAKVVNQRCKATSKLKKKQEKIDKDLSELAVAVDDMNDICCFDGLGVTRLFVDEAHNFKNVPIETKANCVLGINSSGSKRCRDMMDKVHMIQNKNDGKGVIFATGTPITNSITDAYIMQQYLQSGELAMLDLQSFDSWIGMFAERETEFEIDVDTSTYRLASRFSGFHNLTELTSLLSSIADFCQSGDSADVPVFDGYTDVLVSKTPAFEAYLDDISERADAVRNGFVNRKEDNMLKITTDGRKAALDMRLVDPNAVFTYQSKVVRCAETAADIFFRTSKEKSAQLIFCDTSTPKADFNIYTELKERLVLLGVPQSEIAFVHDAETEKSRSILFEKVRNGDIRILIGSTFKLGLGVNIQQRLIALHHIDVPWRPADMTQREGRILRQGNTNDKVYIYRYITQGSFDAYSWQLLETKQRFISELLSGSLAQRNAMDIENTVLDYAQVKALAVGNPLVKQRVQAANELTRYMTLQRKLVESRIGLEKELLEIPGRINNQISLIDKCKLDVEFYTEWRKSNLVIQDNKLKKEEVERRRQLREFIGASIRQHVLETKEKTLMSYRGFNIVLPANLTLKNPYVWLKKSGKYYVELGDTDIGNLIRIDNVLDSLEDHLDGLMKNLEKLRDKERDIRCALSKDESYTDQIETYKKKVEELDKKLGVDKK